MTADAKQRFDQSEHLCAGLVCRLDFQPLHNVVVALCLFVEIP